MSKRPERRLPPNDALQQTIEYGAPMPAFDDNPTNWESRMKARMKGRPILNRFKISKQSMNLTILIGEVFQNVRAADKMGSEDAVWTEYYKLLKRYARTRRQAMADNAEYTANRKEATEYANRLNVPPTIITQYLMGINGKPFDVEFFKGRFDKWVQDNPQGLPDTSRCYEPGFMPDIVAATKTEQEYKAKLDAQNEQSRRELAAITEDRDVTPDDKEAIDKLNTSVLEPLADPVWSAVEAEEGKQQMLAFKHFERELKVIDASANPTEHIIKALGKPLGLAIEEQGIKAVCVLLQKHLDNLTSKNAPKNGDASQPTQTNSNDLIPAKIVPENYPKTGNVESETKEMQPMLKVYPVDYGSIIYKGIKFSVTLCSPNATFEHAIALMEQFAKHPEMIAENCKVAQPATAMPLPSAAPTLPTTQPQAVAPASGVTADKKGRTPGQTGVDVITALEKQVNNGNEIICLWKQNGQFAEHRLNRDSDKAMVAALGISIAGMAVGTKYPCNLSAPWIVTSNLNSKGVYYRDVTALTNNGDALPKSA